jgi:hypothetical protein
VGAPRLGVLVVPPGAARIVATADADVLLRFFVPAPHAPSRSVLAAPWGAVRLTGAFYRYAPTTRHAWFPVLPENRAALRRAGSELGLAAQVRIEESPARVAVRFGKALTPVAAAGLAVFEPGAEMRTAYGLGVHPLRFEVEKPAGALVVNVVACTADPSGDEARLTARIDEGAPVRAPGLADGFTRSQRTLVLPPGDPAAPAHLGRADGAPCIPRRTAVVLGADLLEGRHVLELVQEGGPAAMIRAFVAGEAPARAEHALQWTDEVDQVEEDDALGDE